MHIYKHTYAHASRSWLCIHRKRFQVSTPCRCFLIYTRPNSENGWLLSFIKKQASLLPCPEASNQNIQGSFCNSLNRTHISCFQVPSFSEPLLTPTGLVSVKTFSSEVGLVCTCVLYYPHFCDRFDPYWITVWITQNYTVKSYQLASKWSKMYNKAQASCHIYSTRARTQ